MLSEGTLADLSFMVLNENSGAVFLYQNREVIKRANCIYLKHHFIPGFIEDRNGVKQGTICKIHVNLNIVDIVAKNVDIKVFKRHATEFDLEMPMLREMFKGKNGNTL